MGSYIFLHSRWCDALVSAASNYKDKGGRIDFVCSSREWNISGSTTSLQANGLEFQISIQCRVSISGQQEPIKAQKTPLPLNCALHLLIASWNLILPPRFIIRYIRLLLIMRLAGLREEEEDEEARMKKYHNHILYRPLSERVNVEWAVEHQFRWWFVSFKE